MNADDNTAPELAELLTGVAELVARRSFGGWLPGRVESYNASTGRANVQILLLEPTETETGGRATKRYPVLNDVPVGMIGTGAGGMRIKFPVSKGDTVVLLFCARSSDKWKNLGGEVDPQDDERHHALSDAIALPFDLSAPKQKDASTMIEFTATEIKAGGSNKLVTRAEFLAHTHPVATTGTAAAQAGTASPIAVPSAFPGTAKLRG